MFWPEQRSFSVCARRLVTGPVRTDKIDHVEEAASSRRSCQGAGSNIVLIYKFSSF